MEARTEYPALLAKLNPDQAVNVFNDRIASINKVNTDIADWLQERRRVEEAYVIGLRKLGSRPQHDATALGIFQIPWQRIVSGVENSAASHERLAQKIENDVEKPLRIFQARDTEMKAATNSQSNLANIARDLSAAQKKAEKARNSRKEGGASTSVDDASRQWESQAPFIFEQLQALDERRVNHLRDVLTQLQTHEADQVERSRASAESCLNALLNLETADEIKTFTEKVSANRPTTRRSSVVTSRPPTSSMLAPPEPPPSRQPDLSRRFSAISEQDRASNPPEPPPTKSKLGGLKRLGTVMSRRKSAMPPPPTPEKKKDRRSFAPFRRGDSSRSFQDLEETGRDLTPATSQEPAQTLVSRQQIAASSSRDNLAAQPIVEAPLLQVNGDTEYLPPPGPPPGHQPTEAANVPAPVQDEISVPPPAASSFSEQPLQPALQPQTTGNDSEEGGRAFAIRDQPIKEDESEAQLAMSNMANQLRMQGQTSGINRVQGSIRGRRDVRNTMFVPAGVDVLALGAAQATPAHAPAPKSPPLPASNSTTDLASPIQAPRQKTILEDHALGSETGSIHSSHSLATLAHHPDLHEPGLNVSIVETVNSWFNETGITKSFVTGEVALAYNHSSTTTTAPGQETIRLSHFELLEKVAANPTFVTSASSSAAEDSAGTYTVSLSAIKRPTPTVGLKYQLHLEPSNLAAYSPLLLTPAWQLIEGQASVILLYSLNPAFTTSSPSASGPWSGDVSFKNISISISLDISIGGEAPPAKPTAAQMSPTTNATFKRKTGTVTWRFNELVVKADGGQERLLVRFATTPGVPKRGGVEVRFEVPGRGASAVGVMRHVEGGAEGGRVVDPFADADAGADEVSGGAEAEQWVEVEAKRGMVAGRYCTI